jgi:hypothetical protein
VTRQIPRERAAVLQDWRRSISGPLEFESPHQD